MSTTAMVTWLHSCNGCTRHMGTLLTCTASAKGEHGLEQANCLEGSSSSIYLCTFCQCIHVLVCASNHRQPLASTRPMH